MPSKYFRCNRMSLFIRECYKSCLRCQQTLDTKLHLTHISLHIQQAVSAFKTKHHIWSSKQTFPDLNCSKVEFRFDNHILVNQFNFYNEINLPNLFIWKVLSWDLSNCVVKFLIKLASLQSMANILWIWNEVVLTVFNGLIVLIISVR